MDKLTDFSFDNIFTDIIDYNNKLRTAKNMVNSNGELNFTKVDAFIAATKEAGLKVFGHTLNWHQNQNASYLNGLIAPTVIPGASGSSSLDLSGLKD